MEQHKKKKVTKDGRAILRKTITVIHTGQFRDTMDLQLVRIPVHITQIQRRAFSGCPNLKTVVFEGSSLDSIGEYAFCDCAGLRDMVIPDGTAVECFAFQGCTGLSQPLYNRSGTVLYACPSQWDMPRYRVREGVKTIASTAFLHSPIREIILPESLVQLEEKAFFRCDLRRVTIPASVKRICANTFCDCPHLETVILQGDTQIEPNAFAGCPAPLQIHCQARHVFQYEKFRATGTPFLRAQKTAVSVQHLDDPDFIVLTEGCAEGDPEAMWNLAEYFHNLFTLRQHPFLENAANYWRFQSCLSGSHQGLAWYAAWEGEHPNQQLPAAWDERRCGEDLSGAFLNALGYRSFEADAFYDLHPITEDGIVPVIIHPRVEEGPEYTHNGITFCPQGCWENTQYQMTYLDPYLNGLDIGAILYHPDRKPDFQTSSPDRTAIKNQAIAALQNRPAAPGSAHVSI